MIAVAFLRVVEFPSVVANAHFATLGVSANSSTAVLRLKSENGSVQQIIHTVRAQQLVQSRWLQHQHDVCSYRREWFLVTCPTWKGEDVDDEQEKRQAGAAQLGRVHEKSHVVVEECAV